jgi:hypothetical protein
MRTSLSILLTILLTVALLFKSLYGQPPEFHTEKNDCFLERNEKVYVHLDKYAFISGQPLMYKAYTVNASSLKKSKQSRIIYFEITGNNNKLVYSWRSNLKNGLCYGSVTIPDTISGGFYTLSAYTNWMRNTSPSYHFNTSIIITKINESDLSKLPGLPANPNKMEESQLVQVLQAEAAMTGYILDVETSETGEITINIRTDQHVITSNRLFYLILQSRGKIIEKLPLTISNGTAKVIISKDIIPAGILNIVLFNPYFNPVAEKLMYIPPENFPSLEINTLKQDYGKGDKVMVEIEFNNAEISDTAWLSVSVSEKTPFEALLNNQGIASSLLFYSEIEAGKYAWNLLSYDNSRPCRHIVEYKGFLLTGRVLDKQTSNPIKNNLIVLSCNDTIANLKFCYTDTSGNFYFLLDHSYDNRDLILQLLKGNRDNNNVLWEINNKSCQDLSMNYSTLDLTPEMKGYLEYSRKLSLINNIYNPDTEKDSIPATRAGISGDANFCGRPDYKVFPADFIELKDFREISENILPGVKFRKRGDIYFVQIYDYKNSIIMPPDATVFLNGVPCTNLAYISSLGSKDIKRIDVFQAQIMIGELSFFGILSIYTYDGKIPQAYLDNFAHIYKNEVRMPDFFKASDINVSPEVTAKNKPHFRRTLYWNPGLEMNGHNKLMIEFNASDLQARYDIIVRGITSAGFPIEAISEITVK